MVPKRTVLNNGMVLLTSEQRALPMVAIEFLIDAGSRHEAAQQAGLANLTSQAFDLRHARSAAPCRSARLWISSARGCRPAAARMSRREHDDTQKGFGGRVCELLAEILTAVEFSPDRKSTGKSKRSSPRSEPRKKIPARWPDRAFAAALVSAESLWPAGGRHRGFGQKLASKEPARIFSRATIGPIVRSWRWSAMFRKQEIAQALNKAFRGWTKGAPGAKRHRRRARSASRADTADQ